MLIQLPVFFYILLTTTGLGLLLFRLMTRFSLLREEKTYAMDALTIAGFIVVTVLLQVYSIFFKMGSIVPHLLICAIALPSLFINRKYINVAALREQLRIRSWYELLLVLPFLLGFIQYCALEPRNYDTALYHAQSILWIEQYKAVPGLVNLHTRLAYNASFFPSVAFYGMSFLTQHTLYVLNNYFFLLVLLRIFISIRNSERMADLLVHAFTLVMFYFILLRNISSPTPDTVCSLFVYYLFHFFLCTQKRTDGFDHYGLLTLLLPVFMVTLKLSQAPMVLLLLFFINDKPLRWLKMTLVFAAIVLPWVVRGVILSGYVMYPVVSIDLFSFDWRGSFNNGKGDMRLAKASAITNKMDYDLLLSYPAYKQYAIWFREVPALLKILFSGCVIFPLLLLPGLKQHLRDRRFIFWGVCFVTLIFWFSSAPDARFAHGPLNFCFILPVALFIERFQAWNARFVSLKQAAMLLLCLFGIIAGLFITKTKISFSTMAENIMFQRQMGTPALREKTVDGFIIRMPPERDDRCYGAPIPCAPDFSDKFELRGSTLEEGFRLKKGIE